MKKAGPVVVVVLVVLGLAMVGLSRMNDEAAGPTPAAPAISFPSPPALASTPPPTHAVESTPAPTLFTTDEPGPYAAAVADVVFGMDTRIHPGSEYRALLLGEADPTLTVTGLADLERLVDERIPADDLWQRMRDNGQWSKFVVSHTWEPGAWQQVVTSGQAEPGWAMRNVTGIQTTHYVEHGTPRMSSRERTITIGMRCPKNGATVDRCHLVLVGASVVP